MYTIYHFYKIPSRRFKITNKHTAKANKYIKNMFPGSRQPSKFQKWSNCNFKQSTFVDSSSQTVHKILLLKISITSSYFKYYTSIV